VQWGGSVEWRVGQDDLRKDVQRHQQWGYSTRLIDEAEFHALLPSITPSQMGASCYSDQEGTVDPVQALGVLLKKAQEFGARIEYPCEVTGLKLANQRVRGVETSRGSMEADVLVAACGVGTPQIAKMAGVNVPLKESPGVLAHTAPHARLLERVALAPGATMKQNPDGRIVTGTDFGGTPSPDASREFGEKLLKNAERFLPALKNAKLENVTVGYRVLPEDGHPIVGFSERCTNLYIAAMHSGITLSPLVGQLAASEILDGVAVDLLKAYRPARFM
jgi:glycine/D-amino acid oxidase-like deaminating enzyme